MKKPLLLLILFYISTVMYAQNDPVAVRDTAVTMSQQMVAISVLLNDYDPDGDEIEIRNVRNPEHGESYNNDSIVFYIPDQFTGVDSMEYRIREVATGNSSDYEWIYVFVDENPNIPIAENDEVSVLQLEPTELNLLANDSDPNGDELIIAEVNTIFPYISVEISPDSGSVILTSKYPLNYTFAYFTYKVREKNTNEHYFSEWATVDVAINTNPDIPTAFDDEASLMGGESIDIFVLLNDIDPTNSGLSISYVSSASLGTVGINGDHLTYTANFSAVGTDYFSYTAIVSGQPYLYNSGVVTVNISGNPGRPVAVDDVANGVCGENTVISVLENDYDPDGDPIEIKDVSIVYPSGPLNALIDGSTIVFSPQLEDFVVNTEKAELKYRIQKISNPDAYSDWATISLEMAQDPNFPILQKDVVMAVAGYASEIDYLSNDNLNGYMPKMSVYGNNHGFGELQGDIYVFTPFMSSAGTKTIRYTAAGFAEGYFSVGEIEVEVQSNHSYDSININNINAGIRSDGHIFNKYNEVIDQGPSDFQSHFEYPKGSNHHTIFLNSLWIGGLDQNSNLHLAAQRYKQVGYDFQFGPVANNYGGLEYFTKYSRVWKLDQEEISYHLDNYWQEGYEPIAAIDQWPGNGNVSNGEAAQLAPYHDEDNNGIYDPMSGDYPLIRGDQCILFIFNDDRIHTETDGERMIVEIHGMAYAFNKPTDDLLNNTVFLHYDIYNRSAFTYNNVYLGSWTDFDIGYSWDDYVGSNVALGSYYGYNGTEVDGSGEPEAYGVNPPVQSATIIAGPFMDDDGEDNPSGGCDHSINGLNFGDGIADNERLGMTRFTYHNNDASATGDPTVAPDYYNYLRGIWRDNTPVMFGGNGHQAYGAVGPECMFMYPDESDPCNWGTDGNMPNGGYNQGGKYWTEAEVGNNPSDKRGLGVTGPFTFQSGARQELEMAYSVGQGDNGPQSGIQQLFNNLTTLFSLVEEGEIITPAEDLDVEEQNKNVSSVSVYPNPAKNNVFISYNGDSKVSSEYWIYNNQGMPVMNGKVIANSTTQINIKWLEAGLYIIKVSDQNGTVTTKFIKM